MPPWRAVHTLKEQVQDLESAVANGWHFIDIFPKPDQPWMLHNRFVSRGYEVVDVSFDGSGKLVEKGQYALWVRMGPNVQLANCGCVNHAEEAKPCEHDIELCLGR